MIGTKRKAGRDTAGQAFAAEGNGHFTESRRLRQLPPAAPALALRALCLLDSAFSAGCTIQAALQQVLEDTARRQEGGLAERDRHLAAELAYGTLRMENRLAFVLGKVLRQPLKLPLPLRRLLAVAAYGLLFLDRLPAHAVLHTAVDLARQLYGPGLARVVNGSLRSVQRLGDAVRTPDFYAGPADEETFFAEDAAAARKLRSLALPEAELRLARFHAVPRWLVALWQQAYGDEACRALLARSGARPWQALRVNASRPQAATLKQALLACVPADGPAPQAVGRWGVAFAPGQTPAAVQGEALARLLEQGALSQQAAASQEVMAALGLEDWLGRGWPLLCRARLLLLADSSGHGIRRRSTRCKPKISRCTNSLPAVPMPWPRTMPCAGWPGAGGSAPLWPRRGSLPGAWAASRWPVRGPCPGPPCWTQAGGMRASSPPWTATPAPWRWSGPPGCVGLMPGWSHRGHGS